MLYIIDQLFERIDRVYYVHNIEYQKKKVNLADISVSYSYSMTK